ncbi:hypothetical protein ND861_19150 [Leptospira sp. 2 VSF19]|uniref:DUF6602 domain-containing protein n=1 Tax=Leptospira soteropolitanensis TaxID=2950025 RepID=A0AAW5VI35_9LEPT|nr:DUF6602 domain-containing protein [Leptospira soteropolitanensis]MCW7494788.1 hypothetical protein [Leptospira soteropolitanensis]MCW7502386.1 hypothetical protein [Leptospira soteropolitanensis]MCW7524615.1 hypothetical protein [Leptospira soteropolitanensis]MCW7528482.1 hypothetical protein [Leptospira soteropolitanensis]MCW7532353.1 hypothetical protein [Leptospira soteropolitanensis]
MNPIQKKFEYEIKKIIDEYQYTSESKHPLYTGKSRESLVSNFLANYLTEEYAISNNCFIIDSYGNISKECDIVIYSKKTTKQNLANVEYIPIESVHYVIEVKSISTSIEIKKSIESARIINSLKKSEASKNTNQVIICYFAYNSKSKVKHSDFRKLIKFSGGFSPLPPIPVICIPNKGYYYFGVDTHPNFGILNYAWSVVEDRFEFNIKMFFIGILNTINKEFQIGYYATEFGRIDMLYYKDIVNGFEVNIDRIEQYNLIQKASENGEHEKCIRLIEENFTKNEMKKILPALILNLVSFKLNSSADFCLNYLIQNFSADTQYIEKIKKIFSR